MTNDGRITKLECRKMRPAVRRFLSHSLLVSSDGPRSAVWDFELLSDLVIRISCLVGAIKWSSAALFLSLPTAPGSKHQQSPVRAPWPEPGSPGILNVRETDCKSHGPRP